MDLLLSNASENVVVSALVHQTSRSKDVLIENEVATDHLPDQPPDQPPDRIDDDFIDSELDRGMLEASRADTTFSVEQSFLVEKRFVFVYLPPLASHVMFVNTLMGSRLCILNLPPSQCNRQSGLYDIENSKQNTTNGKQLICKADR